MLVLALFPHITEALSDTLTLKDVYIIITWLSSTYNCVPTILQVTSDEDMKLHMYVEIPQSVTTHALFNCLSQEQYGMVFEAVLAYLDSFDTYANFQNI